MTQIVLESTDLGTQTFTPLQEVGYQSSQTDQIIMRDDESQFDRLAMADSKVQCDLVVKAETGELGVQVAATQMEKEIQTVATELWRRDAEVEAVSEVAEASCQARSEMAEMGCQTKERSQIDAGTQSESVMVQSENTQVSAEVLGQEIQTDDDLLRELSILSTQCQSLQLSLDTLQTTYDTS